MSHTTKRARKAHRWADRFAIGTDTDDLTLWFWCACGYRASLSLDSDDIECIRGGKTPIDAGGVSWLRSGSTYHVTCIVPGHGMLKRSMTAANVDDWMTGRCVHTLNIDLHSVARPGLIHKAGTTLRPLRALVSGKWLVQIERDGWNEIVEIDESDMRDTVPQEKAVRTCHIALVQ